VTRREPGSVTGVLGIDTSGEACRIAYGAVTGRPRDLPSALAAARWREAEDRRGHAERIFSLLDRVLGAPKLSRVGLVAVSGGPGSFTGLRIGMAVAKAFARFGKVPLVAVPTLEAMAAEAALRSRAPLYVPVVDAKRGEVYAALFRPCRGGVVQSGKPAVREPNALRAGLPAGALVVEEPARARTVAALGFLAFSAGKRADPDRLVPVYVRRPEAVEKMRAGLLKRPRRRRSGRRA
jgi:tRNA threonylcarbamoyladenosine biosynthesis protein TsaB